MSGNVGETEGTEVVGESEGEELGETEGVKVEGERVGEDEGEGEADKQVTYPNPDGNSKHNLLP